MLLDKNNIPLRKRLIIRLLGSTFAYEKDSLRYYYGHCEKHGYFIDHLREYDRISCPQCLQTGMFSVRKGLSGIKGYHRKCDR